MVREEELGTAGKLTSGAPAAPLVAPLITLDPSNSLRVPVTSGNIIRIPLPLLTEERRIELTKQVKNEEEQAKVSVRNIRRDSIQDLKDFLNEKMISEDDFHKGQSDVQQITDRMIEDIESLSNEKQKDLMTI